MPRAEEFVGKWLDALPEESRRRIVENQLSLVSDAALVMEVVRRWFGTPFGRKTLHVKRKCFDEKEVTLTFNFEIGGLDGLDDESRALVASSFQRFWHAYISEMSRYLTIR